MRTVLAFILVWEASSALADGGTYNRPTSISKIPPHIQSHTEKVTRNVIERLEEIEYLKSAMLFCASRSAGIRWEAIHDLLSAKIQDLEAAYIAEHAEITPSVLEYVARHAATKRDQMLKQIDKKFDEKPEVENRLLVLRLTDYSTYCHNTINSALMAIN